MLTFIFEHDLEQIKKNDETITITFDRIYSFDDQSTE